MRPSVIPFSQFIREVPQERICEILASATPDRALSAVRRAVALEPLTLEDFASLISEPSFVHIETIAQAAAAVTRSRFGNTMTLYAPVYVSNECVNACAYCGFNCRNKISRVTLSLDEAAEQFDAVRARGFGHVLILTGESRRAAPIEYLDAVIRLAAQRFDSVSIEVYPLERDEYARLVTAGCDGITVYQETYDPAVYSDMHPAGPKRDYNYRLDTPGRAADAGIRTVGLGALLGLSDWRIETLYIALHARYVMANWWRTKLSVSFPRLRPANGGFQPLQTVTDANLVQMLVALRLFLPDAELVVSTREPAALRDRLLPLGVTRMSAGSRTAPGGYTESPLDAKDKEQFSIDDQREPEIVAAMIESHGFEAVWKDFDRAMM
ncbi:MAG: 2-iminoacetate synthase ThiH [Planctomycetota bacterium]